MKNSINIHSGDLQIATADNVKINKDYISALNDSNTVSCVDLVAFPEWSSYSGTCPECKSHNMEINNTLVLASNPPQSQLRCKDCGYYCGSGMLSSTEPEPPSYPDISIPSKDLPMGWVCPKCGSCWAPYTRGCSHCNTSEIKITY